jgi:hypothetical protein
MLDTAQPNLPFADPLPATLAPPPTKRRSSGFPILDAPANPAQRQALRHGFMGLFKRWAPTGEETLQLLGEPSDDASAREARLNALVGVNRSLQLVLPDQDSCLCYLRRACKDFAGASLLQIMLADGLPGIERVRDYLAHLARKPLVLAH